MKNEINRGLLTIAIEDGIGNNAGAVPINPQAVAHDHDEYGTLFHDVEVEEVVINMALDEHENTPGVLENAVDAQLTLYWTSEGIKRTSAVNGAYVLNNPLE